MYAPGEDPLARLEAHIADRVRLRQKLLQLMSRCEAAIARARAIQQQTLLLRARTRDHESGRRSGGHHFA
jgi:hypothetical protein